MIAAEFVGPLRELLPASSRLSRTAGGGVSIDSRRPSWFEAQDFAGCALDAPDYVPCGAHYSVEHRSWCCVVAVVGRVL